MKNRCVPSCFRFLAPSSEGISSPQLRICNWDIWKFEFQSCRYDTQRCSFVRQDFSPHILEDCGARILCWITSLIAGLEIRAPCCVMEHERGEGQSLKKCSLSWPLFPSLRLTKNNWESRAGLLKSITIGRWASKVIPQLSSMHLKSVSWTMPHSLD